MLLPHARYELLMEYRPLSAESLVGRQASRPTVDHSGSLAAGESGLLVLVGRRQHDLSACVGAGGKYLGLVGRGG